MLNRKSVGNKGEEEAAKYLVKNKYKIMAKNFRCIFGEIDIIAMDGEDVVFVEVKVRRSSEYGMPEEAVTGLKQKKIIRSALEYVKLNRLPVSNLRFDILAIGPESNRIELIKSAFSTDGFYTY